MSPAQHTPIVLLDVDGTLIDSFPGVRESFLRALDSAGITPPPESALRSIVGPPMRESLRRFGVKAADMDTVFATYLQAYEEIGQHQASPYPGVDELLTQLQGRGYRLATATSKGERFTRLILTAHGLIDAFEVIAAAEEHGPRTSKADVIAHGLALLQVPLRDGRVPAEQPIVLLGDREHDIHGASVFGIPTIAAGWGYGSREECAAALTWCASVDQAAECIATQVTAMQT